MALEHESDSALARAVRAAGSQSAFARLVGTRQSTVHDWLKTGRISPDRKVMERVERGTGISRHDLRPDVFGPAPASLAGAADQLEPAR